MLSQAGRFDMRAAHGASISSRAALLGAAVSLFASCTELASSGGTGGSTQVQVPPDAGSAGGRSGAGGVAGSNGTGGTAFGTGGRVGSGGSQDAGSSSGGRGAGGSGNGSGGATAADRDAGATEAGTSTALCPPAALVCEDFEDGKADGWSALVTGMSISTVRASSGTNSLGLTVPANQRGGMITMKGAPLFPLVNKIMWGRVMVWFEGLSDGHTDIIRGQAASGGNPTYNVAEQTGAYMLNYYNGTSATDCWARPRAPTPTVVALNKWMCWEWRFDAGTNDMQFFVDGTLYRRVMMTGDGCLTGNGVWAAPADFGLVGIGATVAQIGPKVTQAWFDDIAIGTRERIGCPTR